MRVKICGLTRGADAQAAAAAGASFAGVVFAASPRQVSVAQARGVFAGLDPCTRKVGVFGSDGAAEIVRKAEAAGVDVIQLHGDPDAREVEKVRRLASRPVWAAARVTDRLDARCRELFEVADAVVLDARTTGALGGSGKQFNWGALADAIPNGRRAMLVAAGGLDATNVGLCIDALSPDVVDVSSGVESSPGVKDPRLVGEFIVAATKAGAAGAAAR